MLWNVFDGFFGLYCIYLFVYVFILKLTLCHSDLSVSPSIAAALAYLILSLLVNLVGLEEL